MKRYFLAAAMIIACGFQLFCQVEPSVSIKLDDEERFRFEEQRLEFVNPGHHVLIGDSAGYNLDNSAAYNVFMGYRAGFKTTTGWDNVFIGDSAGYENIGGQWNTAVGSWAGYGNTEGSNNAFYGQCSGVFNTTGNSNSYFGFQSGAFNTTGSLNSFFGFLAGYGNKGIKNVFLGAFAGKENLGDSNVFIGYSADMPGSNLLVIANASRPNPFIYGEFDNQILRFNAVRIEQRNSLENTILGDSSGWQTKGLRNVFVGFKSGFKNTYGNDNTFIGDSTGYSNTSGYGNVFVGNWTGYLNTTGQYNLFAGVGSGMHNTEANGNVMLGTMTGANNISGHQNVFLGWASGIKNISGFCNTFLGCGTGYKNQTGTNSVFIGYYAGYNETESNRLYISNSDTDAPLIYGEFDNEILKFHGETRVVDHDVYITDYNKGIILTSQDGDCWRFTADNDGNLIKTQITCP